MKKEARLFQVDQDLKFLILLLFLECIGNSHLVMRTEHCRLKCSAVFRENCYITRKCCESFLNFLKTIQNKLTNKF